MIDAEGARLVATGVASALVTALAILVVDAVSDARTVEARLDRYGAAMADQLAALAVEPLIAGDKVMLGVLVTRISALPEIKRVSVFTIDDRPMALAGNSTPAEEDRPFTEPITFENAVAGYVRVVVDARFFHARAAPWELLAAVLAVFAVVVVAMIARHAPGRGAAPSPASERIDAEEASVAAPDARHTFVLVVNLFNQISIPASERGALLETCRGRLARVCALYGGRAELLPGTGLLAAFDGDGDERAFQVVCAALLSASVLGDLNDDDPVEGRPELVFRFGVHVTQGCPEVEEILGSEALNDAVLLSAVAPDGDLAMSMDAHALVPRAERLVTTAASKPVLAALATAERCRCMIVADVTAAYADLLDRQAAVLLA